MLTGGFLYSSSKLLSYPGNSGGPLCVQFSNGKYYPAAIFIALDEKRVYLRALDSKVVNMIADAELSGQTGTNASSGGVTILSSEFAESDDETGFLKVNLEPKEAVDAGAGWRFAGGDPTYNTSASTLAQVLTFGYSLEFKPLDGFVTPPNRQVQVANGVTTLVEAVYERKLGANQPSLAFNRTEGLRLRGESGTRYRIESTVNLSAAAWSTLTTVVLAGESMIVVPLPVPPAGSRFYRAVVVP